LNPDIICTATYYDAKITYPERLCLELVQDAEKACAWAHALNYVQTESAAGSAVTLRDEVTGKSCEVKPKVVVNATGAWIDLTNRSIGRESEFIGGTKGSHIVLDHPELAAATGNEMIYFVNRDGRICIFYVVCGKVIAGATDIPTDDPDAACDEGEVDYLLDSLRMAFPSIHVDRSHVVFRICGVRPLPRSNAFTPGQISRDHSFRFCPRAMESTSRSTRWWAASGLPSARLPSRLAPRFLRLLGRPRLCDSADLPIGGGEGYPRMPQGTGLPQRAACGSYGAFWNGRGSRRRIFASWPGCAARLPPRLLASGDRVHGAQRARRTP